MTTDYDRAASKTQAGLTRQLLEAMKRARPLCPDHRDKQVGKPCLACTIETLDKRIVQLTTALQNMVGMFDTPVVRMKFDSDYHREACASAREALKGADR